MVRAQNVRRSSILLSLADAEDHVGPTSECADTPSPRTAEYTPPMTSLSLSVSSLSYMYMYVNLCSKVHVYMYTVYTVHIHVHVFALFVDGQAID